MKMLTTVEAAEMLRISPQVLRRLVREGRIPTVGLLPGKLLFDQEAVEAHLKEMGCRRSELALDSPVPAA